jgi:hypothetical protein
MSSFRRLGIKVMSFLVLLNTLSHSVDIAGIERVSQIQSAPLLRFASFWVEGIIISYFPSSPGYHLPH